MLSGAAGNAHSRGYNNRRYDGAQPYNNFHISAVDAWREPKVRTLWARSIAATLFMKYRLGDANYHAIIVLLLGRNRTAVWPSTPLVHNTNDGGANFPHKYVVHRALWSNCSLLGVPGSRDRTHLTTLDRFEGR